MESFRSVFKTEKTGLKLSTSFSTNVFSAVTDVDAISKHRPFFESLYSRYPLECIADMDAYFYFLLTRKICVLGHFIRYLEPDKAVLLSQLVNDARHLHKSRIHDAIEFTNTYAPEHLIISTEDDKAVLDKIKNAGSIFLGKYSPVAAGDYGSGTNHVLPTSGGAKMYSGLSTESFLKKPTVQTITKEGIEELAKTVIPIAEYEGFHAHANSVRVRLGKKDD